MIGVALVALAAPFAAAQPAPAAIRCSLFNDQWTGTQDNNWFNAANWSGGVPGASDTACIAATRNTPVVIGTGATAEVNRLVAGADVTLSAGTLKLDNTTTASTISATTLTVSGGTLQSSAGITFNLGGTLHWISVSTITGGTIELTSGSTLTIDGFDSPPGHVLTAVHLMLDAGATGTWSDVNINASGGSLFDIGGNLSLTGFGFSGWKSPDTSAVHLLAGGTLSSNGSGSLVNFSNDGNVAVNKGILAVRGGPHSGNWNAAANAILEFLGAQTQLSSGSFGGTGTIQFVQTSANLSSATTVPAGLTFVLDHSSVSAAGLTVDGTLRSSSSGNSFINGPLQNHGLVHAQSGGGLVVFGGGGGSSTGTWETEASSGITFDLGFGNTQTLNGGSFVGFGTVSVSSGTVQILAPVSATAGVTVNLYGPPAGSTLANTSTLTVAGRLHWGGGNSTITGNGTTEISSGGALDIDDAFNGGPRSLRGAHTLKLDAGASGTWSGAVDVQMGEGASLVVGGTLTVTNDRALLNLGGVPPSVRVLAGGTFAKTGGAGSTSSQVPLTDDGTLAVRSGMLNLAGGLTNYDGETHTLTGGAYVVSGGSTLQFPGADVQTNAADITLDGVGSKFSDGTLDGLRNLTLNGAAGHLTLRGGTAQTTSGAFTTQGSLGVVVSGPTPGVAGELQVAGNATLGGTLALATASGFVPPAGQTYTLMTYPSRSGKFKTITGQQIPSSPLAYKVAVGSNSIVLTTVQSADVKLSGTAPASTPSGSNYDYTWTIDNLGPGVAKGVVLTDTLPATLTFVSASPGCTRVGQKVTCKPANMNSGTSVSFTITVTAPGTPQTVRNTASVKTSSLDLVTPNNKKTLTTTITWQFLRSPLPARTACHICPGTRPWRHVIASERPLPHLLLGSCAWREVRLPHADTNYPIETGSVAGKVEP